MNSDTIFDYSEEFLKEIIDNIIYLKRQKVSSPKNTEFDNKLRAIVGKSFNEKEFQELIEVAEVKLKEKIINKFQEARDERVKILGEKYAKEIEKRIFLQSIDLNWKSHIQYLEQLRQVIGLRSYGQRDPLIEYKKEAFELFKNLLDKLKLDYVTILMNLKVVKQTSVSNSSEIQKNTSDNPKCLLILNKDQKISRNERCEATGKKFKNCCGAL
jgi:preprotein translocase subunit SecA